VGKNKNGVVMNKKSVKVEHGNKTINISNIEIGKVYDNWRYVCEALGFNYSKYKKSRRKNLLLSKLSKYLEYERNKHTYVFTKYKSPPIVSFSGMRDKNKIIKLALINNIANYVRANPDNYSNSIVFNWNKLFRAIGVVNGKYIEYEHNKGELANELDVNNFVVDDFYDKAKKTIKRAIITSLNSLQSDNALIWYPTFRITYTDGDNDEVKIAKDEDIKLVLESDDKAYRRIYKKYVSTPRSHTDNFSGQKIKVIGYLTRTENWYLFYNIRNNIMTGIWNRENETDFTVTGIYKVVKIIENMYRFKRYGDILDNHNFNPYEVSEIMQDVLTDNANNRNKRDKGALNQTTYNETGNDIKKRVRMTSDNDFVYNFWCTVNYCMEDSYDAKTVISDMNL